MPTRNVNFLTDELDHFVLQKVESARYENASEVVRAALRAAAGWLCWLLFRPAAAGLAGPYESRYGRFTASPARTALKNSQLIRRPPDDITIICETVH